MNLHRCTRPAIAGTLVLAGALTFTGRAHAADCAGLKALQLPHVSITLAEPVAAGALKLPGAGMGPAADYSRLPALCRVAGTSRPTPDSEIRFEVWLPLTGWNGKFVSGGNGVWAGSIAYGDMLAPLAANYAAAASDLGHQGSPMDASFAAGHPEKLADFGHRALHETTVAAKAIVQAFYGKPAARSLYVSCSTGGRVGLMEAYRYPDDFDGISAMAPANPMVDLMIGSLYAGHVAMKDAESRIPPPKFQLVHKAVVAACDADDGVQDGIVSAPQRCKFDPAALQCKAGDGTDCLTAGQVATLRGLYTGPRNPRTGKLIYPGFAPGSEGMLPMLTGGNEPFPVATTFMRSLVFQDPKWDFRSFDYDRDVAKARAVASDMLDVPAKGPVRFLKRGGKLLLSHGWADGLIAPQGTISFYEQLQRSAGRSAARNVRLFMIPGMGHCSGGEGPHVVDMLGTIDRWVETGVAPERITARNPPGAPARSRPLCPWPQEARYTGSGGSDEEGNFRCVAP